MDRSEQTLKLSASNGFRHLFDMANTHSERTGMLLLLQQLSRDLLQGAKDFHRRRVCRPLSSEWLQPLPLEALDQTEVVKELQLLRERLQKAEEAFSSVQDEVSCQWQRFVCTSSCNSQSHSSKADFWQPRA